MTADHPCSLTFSAAKVRAAFAGATVDKVVLALLAGIRPEPTWEGCSVSQAQDPRGVRLEIRGPAAGTICNRLAARMEQVGLDVLEHGADPEPAPEVRSGLAPSARVARVEGGSWT